MRKSEINKFSETAEIYAEVRPTYPEDMYRKIAEMVSDMANKNILEVGPGPGNSTREFMQYFPARITACEPNPDFGRLFAAQFTADPHVTLKNEHFEENAFAGQSFDVIYAATTFHWLDQAAKYAEASRLLTPEGWLITCWNNYLLMDVELKEKLSALFTAYDANIEMINGTMEKILAKIDRRKNEIESGAYFSVVLHDLFETKYSYSAEQFCALLRTFADQSLGDRMATLLQAVRVLVMENGDELTIKVITNLEIARKTGIFPQREK